MVKAMRRSGPHCPSRHVQRVVGNVYIGDEKLYMIVAVMCALIAMIWAYWGCSFAILKGHAGRNEVCQGHVAAAVKTERW